MAKKPSIDISYCPRCHWLMRSAWLAQELLTTFDTDLEGVTLKPSEQSGLFEIRLDNQLIWERQRDSGFPEAKVLKQRVRDCIDPSRSLGHSDS